MTAGIGKKERGQSVKEEKKEKKEKDEEIRSGVVVKGEEKTEGRDRTVFYDRVTRSKFSVDLLTKISGDDELTDVERYFILIASGNLDGLKVFVPNPPEGWAIRKFVELTDEYGK